MTSAAFAAVVGQNRKARCTSNPNTSKRAGLQNQQRPARRWCTHQECPQPSAERSRLGRIQTGTDAQTVARTSAALPLPATVFLGKEVAFVCRPVYCSDRVLLAGDDRRYREATQATVPIVDQLYDDVPTLRSISVCLNSLRVVSPGNRR